LCVSFKNLFQELVKNIAGASMYANSMDNKKCVMIMKELLQGFREA
jgi:hypothetical protein